MPAMSAAISLELAVLPSLAVTNCCSSHTGSGGDGLSWFTTACRWVPALGERLGAASALAAPPLHPHRLLARALRAC